ncbi:MAG: GNAT family N-acetyltransferase [Pirellulales bacterium]|jgi:CelD/BcsL family acetyltransferase involved in cellulose biosynthesis
MPSKQVWKDIPVIDVSQSWDEYLETRKSKNRQNIRRLLRRAEEREIQFERIRPLGSAFCDADPQWETFDNCVDLAARSWQGASTTGTTISHENVIGYFRDVHQIAAKRGMLDLSILKQGEDAIAFGYNYHHENHIQGMRVGYDTEKKNLGLGTLLYATQLRDSCNRGDLQFDLGPGSMQVKQQWLSKVIQSWRICHYSALSLRSQALRLKHWYSTRQREKSAVA